MKLGERKRKRIQWGEQKWGEHKRKRMKLGERKPKEVGRAQVEEEEVGRAQARETSLGRGSYDEKLGLDNFKISGVNWRSGASMTQLINNPGCDRGGFGEHEDVLTVLKLSRFGDVALLRNSRATPQRLLDQPALS
eukprot:6188129-Pleurochrysis_carterae.AAC.1